MKFDDIMITIGEFGRYQRRTYNLCCLFAFLTAFHLLASVFITGSADHWCKIPEWDEVNCTEWGYNTTEECQELKRSIGIPSNISETGDVTYAQCSRYNLSGIDYFRPDLDLSGRDVVSCDAGWVYDRSVFQSSIVIDFDLVCGSSYLTSVSQSLYFLGVLIGSLVFGHISDIFGRQKSLFFSCGFILVTGTAVAFSPNVWVYAILYLLVGAAMYGTLISSFVLGTEMVGPSKRYLAGMIIELYFSVGYMLLAAIAYLIRNWRHLQLFISLISLAYFMLYPFLPESARWLMAKKKLEPAEKIIRKAAKVNRVKLPDILFEEREFMNKSGGNTGRQPNVFDLFRTPRLRRNTLNLIFNWIVNTLVYYGLSLSTDSLGVDIYLAFFVSGAVEIPAYTSVLFGIEYFGRRPMIVSYMIAGGIACLATIFIPAGPGRVAVAMIGKFGIAGSFAIAYLYPAEIFPTPIRAAGLGMCAMASRVAGMISPLIILLGDYWKPLPFLIFGISSILAGILALFLPETKGRRVPETIEEGENFGRTLLNEPGDDEYNMSESPEMTSPSDFKYQKAPDVDTAIET
ncbi:organic cation transporter protein [Strongylocentrotus purpuratus]|uniref:Major facilitator superfamily (MFS) profile domain-containing protein n=1 Tax=Strongylocentrotus purpuratus TaxID=7668 RepID=A0A7M7PIH0_STRPU|nr:organic cation transporter protein [Strongylocentrotus purpuratus]